MTLNQTQINQKYVITEMRLSTFQVQHLAGLGIGVGVELTIFSNANGMVIARSQGNKIVLDKILTQNIEVKLIGSD